MIEYLVKDPMKLRYIFVKSMYIDIKNYKLII